MALQTQAEVADDARRRRERILTYITQDPPVPYANIRMMEGMHDRSCRVLIHELEEEHGIKYLNTPASKAPPTALPYGLTDATARLRGRLGDHLHSLRTRGRNHDAYGRNQIAPLVGMNPREQGRAEALPFNHDWTLSQIERLARELGEAPKEFLLKCLTT